MCICHKRTAAYYIVRRVWNFYKQHFILIGGPHPTGAIATETKSRKTKMAKKSQQKISVPQSVTNQIQDAINSKKEKEGGRRFVLKEEFKIPGQTTMPAETKLVESNDNYFHVVINGRYMHYRIGAKWLKEMNVSEVPNSD